MELSKRLQAVLSLIDDGTTILDIGCDHAYLSIEAINSSKAIKAYAIDNKELPLNQAKKNIQINHLEEYIIPILSDGFKNIKNIDYDEVIIAGMGGLSIIDILKNAENIDDKTFILEANRDNLKLREYLVNNGFELINELLVLEDDFYYFVIKCIKNGINTKLSQKELEFGPILIKEKNKNLLFFIEKNLKIYEDALKESKNNIKLKEKISYLMEVRNEIK